MNVRPRLLVSSLALALAGCATRPALPGDSRPPGEPAAEQPVPAGHFALWIESEPSGAMVVVEGIPKGRTPLRLTIPGTPQGFFRADTPIRVRFVAADANQSSVTTGEVFTPMDRIPTRLLYTPDGVQRTR